MSPRPVDRELTREEIETAAIEIANDATASGATWHDVLAIADEMKRRSIAMSGDRSSRHMSNWRDPDGRPVLCDNPHCPDGCHREGHYASLIRNSEIIAVLRWWA